MSDSHHDQTESGEMTIKVEPDDVPTAMLTKLAVIVTIAIVACVVFVNMVFDQTLADELAAKGYTDATAVPGEHSSAKTWE
ncbi:MAG: hypothetical protein VX000_05280 [Myxococcota bacterium]|nr:hypothetical protein [Myxococcota bacterium]